MSCQECGTRLWNLTRCKLCGQKYCFQHADPEEHDCGESGETDDIQSEITRPTTDVSNPAMYCQHCGTELDTNASFCTSCGEPVDGAKGSASSEVAAVTSSNASIPADAVAIDVMCQHCGQRPIEEVAKGHRVAGLVLFYQMKSYQLLGCHRCVRRKLWGMSLKNLVLGWWGIRAAVLNAVLTLKNVSRSFINRGPNSNLIEALEDVGVTFDYLADPSNFQPEEHSPDELYIRSLVRLGTAIMLADGEALPEEQQAIRNTILTIFPEYPEEKIDTLINRASQSPADVERVAEGLGEVLGSDGEVLVVNFAAAIADAGVADSEGIELAAKIARGLDLDEDDVAEALQESPEMEAAPA